MEGGKVQDIWILNTNDNNRVATNGNNTFTSIMS